MTGPALRRTLHAASGAVVMLVPLGSWELLRTVLLVVGGVGVLLEFVRLSVPSVRETVGRMVPVFRSGETSTPSGAMWLGVGFALAALVPPPAPVAGILVAALADPAASLVGTWHRAPGRKTWQGSLAHAITASAVLALLGWPVLAVFAGATVATTLERVSFGLNDNLVVAPATALTVLLAS